MKIFRSVEFFRIDIRGKLVPPGRGLVEFVRRWVGMDDMMGCKRKRRKESQ